MTDELVCSQQVCDCGQSDILKLPLIFSTCAAPQNLVSSVIMSSLA